MTVIRTDVYPHMLITITTVVKILFGSVLNKKYKILF